MTKTKGFIASAIGLPLLVIGLFSLLVDQYWQSQIVNKLMQQQSQLLSRAGTLFSRELGHIRQITLYAKEGVKKSAYDFTPESSKWRDTVATEMAVFPKVSPLVAQIRWLSVTGQELVRLDVKNGKVERIAENELQNKASRYYFQQGKSKPKNAVFLTPIDLNVEHGRVVEPYEITIRSTTRLLNAQGKDVGLLIINYNLNELFQRLSDMANVDNTLELVNEQGDWLISDVSQYAWRHIYGDHEHALSIEFPDIWSKIEKQRELVSITQKNIEISALPVQLDMELEQQSFYVPTVYFLSRGRDDMMADNLWKFRIVIGSIGSVCYLSIAWALLLLIRSFNERRKLIAQLHNEKDKLEEAHEDLKNTAKNLVALESELTEASKLSALGMMVSGVAHELNTPLGGLKMTLSSLSSQVNQLKRQGPDSKLVSALENSLNIGRKNLERAIDIVASFKRLTLNRTSNECESFELKTVINDTLLALKPLCKGYPYVKVLTEFPVELRLTGFPGILSQILQNLVGNALSHGFESGMTGEIIIRASLDKGAVTVQVEDNGKGIDASFIDDVFNPFVTTGRHQKHTGLGLHLVHQWVTGTFHGDISVVSHQGITRFTLVFPQHIQAKNRKTV